MAATNMAAHLHGRRLLALVLFFFTSCCESLKANSWQARLDKALLSVDAPPQARARMLRRALGDPQLSKDLRKAVKRVQKKGMKEGHPELIETLWPTGTTARSDIEALFSLRKTLPEALAAVQAQAPELLREASQGNAAPPPNPLEVANALAGVATDRTKQEAFLEEAKDVFRSTPKKLETPDYSVVRTLEGPTFLGKPERIELRAYAPFTVARRPMGQGSDAKAAIYGGSSGGDGFNVLASYLFGGNEETEAMAMTTPVEISSGGSASPPSMSFVLPKKNAANPPTPKDGSEVQIAEVPARLVAVKPFPGLVTEEEVARQKAALLDTLAADGSVAPVDADAVSVLQYNGPFTLLFRRRNEIAIVVSELDNADATTTAEGEAPVGAEAEEAAGEEGEEAVVSWYDSGVRLY